MSELVNGFVLFVKCSGVLLMCVVSSGCMKMFILVGRFVRKGILICRLFILCFVLSGWLIKLIVLLVNCRLVKMKCVGLFDLGLGGFFGWFSLLMMLEKLKCCLVVCMICICGVLMLSFLMIGVWWKIEFYDVFICRWLMLMNGVLLLCLVMWSWLILSCSVYGLMLILLIEIGCFSSVLSCVCVRCCSSGGLLNVFSSLNVIKKISMLIVVCLVCCDVLI